MEGGGVRGKLVKVSVEMQRWDEDSADHHTAKEGKAINHIWVRLAQNLDETNASDFEWYPEFWLLMSFSNRAQWPYSTNRPEQLKPDRRIDSFKTETLFLIY